MIPLKRILSFLFCLAIFVCAKAQNNYAEAIQQGDDAFNRQQYKTAINKYFAAEAFDPTKKNEVKAKINRAFEKIEALRAEAELAKKQAENALKAQFVANKQKMMAEQAQMEAIRQKKMADEGADIAKQALQEVQKAKDNEHDALVRSIAQLNNIQTVQDSLKKEINNIPAIDAADKIRLIVILESAQTFRMTATASNQKIISEYVISNEGKKFPKVYSVGDNKFIGVNFPLDASFSRAKIEALGVSFDDVLSGKRSLTEAQIDILFESDLEPFLKQAKALFPNFSSFNPYRQAALVDLIFFQGTGFFKKVDISASINSGNWAAAADKLNKYALNRYSSANLGYRFIIKRINQDAEMLLTGSLPKNK